MGGTKRKIKIEKIEKKSVKSVAFTKRRNGLFRKASELCLLSSGTQIAILATPPSSNSHASFYSFGHSSVDHVVSSLLHDQPPNQERNKSSSGSLGFWWEDECFDRLENVDELKEATEAVTRMLNNVRLRLDGVIMSDQRDDGGLRLHQEVTTTQIIKFEGNSGLSDKEEDILHIDDFFGDAKIDPLF